MSTGGRLAGARVLVTGASGFVGRRVVERLASEGAHVRVLVREIARAGPLSRFPIEVAVGDLLRPEEVAAAVAGCERVIHCAKGSSGTSRERREVDVSGTRNVLEAATRVGARRVVHTSTVVVYEDPGSGVLDEHASRTRSRDPYRAGKRDGEAVALTYARRGAPVTVIQPTVVYGPHAGVYGREILDELVAARLPLVDGGAGTCNAVFVDDVVTAILLAAVHPDAPGEAFLVTGPEPTTWREFYGAFERMLGLSRTVPLSADEARRLWRAASRRPWLVAETARAVREDARLRGRLLSTREGRLIRRAAERILPASFFAPERWEPPSSALPPEEPPVAVLRPEVIDFLASRTTVSGEKARRVLGFEPAFDLEAGMSLTEQWAEHEGLLDADR
jgi:nucleoside-diphosphate-sugar epimerase